MKRSEEGITLIALMITIIVLIILAAITIISVTNHNVVGKASKGAEEYAKGQDYELGEINNITKLLGDFENKMEGGSGGNSGDKMQVDKETSYVGYYADIDGDGEVDGIIYADLAKGNTGSGKWNNDKDSTYTIPVEEDVKEYYISKTGYEGLFGIKDVLSPKGAGNDRFYVMTLKDIDGKQNGTQYYWYYNAYSKGMKDYAEATSGEFGTGKTNTATMIEKWNKKVYGEQYEKDMWGQIKEEVSKGWFVPSRGEWSAFGEELGITKENYESKGISRRYWSSSQFYERAAWFANMWMNGMSSDRPENPCYVRLSATF